MRSAVCIGALLFLWACGSEPQRHPNAPIIIVTIDTLRADRLPVYGYDRIETPNIDALAQDGVVFDWAWASVPITLPSHATLFTGKHPAGHGVRENVGYKLSESHLTLAEFLSTHGYQTGAAVSSMVLRKSTGIARGFHFYDDRPGSGARKQSYGERPGQETLESAVRWLESIDRTRPFFLWVHLFEPHTPYIPPEPYKSRYADAYDGEVAWSDELLGRFVKQLKAMGVYDRSALFLLSDHGEGLGDHGEEEHGLFVYREAVHVPFIVKLPGSALAGSRFQKAVGLIDVLPTITDLLDFVPIESGGMALFSGSIPDRPIYSEALTAELFYGWYPSYSVAYKNKHYIESHKLMAFDLENDFFEQNDLNPDVFPPQAAREMNKARGNLQERSEVSQQDRELLASLGYVGDFQMGDELRQLSPEAFLQIYEDITRAQQLITAGKHLEAETLMVAQLERFPSLLSARIMLGQALYLQGKYETAEYVCTEGLAVAPDNERLLLGLAAVKLELGKNHEALLLARKGMKQAPLLTGHRLAPLFHQKELVHEALEIAGLMIDHDPAFAFAWSVFSRSNGDDPALTAQLMRSTTGPWQTEPELYLNAANQLALLYAKSGKAELAVAIWRKNLEQGPNHAPTRLELSRFYAAAGAQKKAVEVIDRWLYDFPSRKNYLQAGRFMEEIGILDAAGFYREQADKYQ